MKNCFGILCFLLCILQWGCGINDGQTGSVSEQSMSEQTVSGQSVSAVEDPVEIQTVNEDSYVLLMPDQFTADGFYIVSENMLNYEEAVEKMVIAQPAERERTVVSFCDTFPKELQEAFQYEIEHYREVDVHFGEYNTGLEWHAIEEFPYEIPSELSYGVTTLYGVEREFSYQKLDLDGDGEVEYLIKEDNQQLYTHYRRGYVYKIVDGEPVLCFMQPLEEMGMESLYYEGDYYLYMGNALVRCGEGCDLLAYRYEDNLTTYTPGINSLRNTCLEYIMGWIEKGDYTWHEGYRAEGYEEIDFRSYLPEGLENHLPMRWTNSVNVWHFETTDESPGGQFFERFYLPIEVEGRNCEYLFLRKENSADRDVIVVVLVPEGDVKYTIACMYSLIYTYEFSLTDEREYIDELVAVRRLAFECVYGLTQNDSYDELMELYQPNRVTEEFHGCHSLEGTPLVELSYGEGKTAIAVVYGEEFKIIYDDKNNTESTFLEPGSILEHVLDQETGTESYLYYEIYTDVYDAQIVLKESFARVDEDRDGIFTEADSYYCNGYELDQYTWERWQILYRNYSGD